ncbi:phage tail protein [Achromobacter sp. UMC71]|uniref:phage tail protein n=1 Tax=Achromobacter sp. UMC71 TaxID=1862320 RepID=UPI001604872A|nr:phage tail protein [Achromobacter sp. UMC71]MBB1625816.1 phage tail protein [Achromobacter sp. UMC71]
MQILKPIKVGQAPNDQTGDTLRDAMVVVNENFTKTRSGVDAVEVAAAAAQRKADAAIPAAEKGAAGGVTPLDASGKVPAAHLPEPAIPLAQKAAPGGVAPLDEGSRVPVDFLPVVEPAVPLAQKGQPGGVATLAADGKIAPAQLPDLIPAAEKAQPNGVATLAADGRIVAGQLPALIPAADKGRPGGVPTLDADGRVPAAQLPAVQDAVPLAQKGQPGGVATLGAEGKVPFAQLPPIDSIPLGFVSWWPSRAAIPAGWAPLDGQTISRATYPDMWASVQAGNFPLVPEATWQSDATARASYTTGDGSTTLRVPDLNGKSSGTLGAVMLRGDGLLSAGTAAVIQRDATQRVVGTVALSYGTTQYAGSGAFYSEEGAAGGSTSYPYNNPNMWLKFDNAREARTATETRPLNATGCWVVKLFGVIINPGSADAAQLASDYAELNAQLQSLKGALGFTILYPGGGNAAAPGVVAINSQYVLANPFPGHHLILEPEVLYNGEWGNPGWWDGDANMSGVRVGMRGDLIVVSTARNALGIGYGLGGGVFPYTGNIGLGVAGLPARIKVWKMMGAAA